MVKDLITNTIKNLKSKKINSIKDVYGCSNQLVCFSSKFKEIESEIKSFLRFNMYNNKNVLIKNNNGKKIIVKLFHLIKKKPKKFLSKKDIKYNMYRNIADFISGMTDRYAINLYNKNK